MSANTPVTHTHRTRFMDAHSRLLLHGSGSPEGCPPGPRPGTVPAHLPHFCLGPVPGAPWVGASRGCARLVPHPALAREHQLMLVAM